MRKRLLAALEPYLPPQHCHKAAAANAINATPGQDVQSGNHSMLRTSSINPPHQRNPSPSASTPQAPAMPPQAGMQGAPTSARPGSALGELLTSAPVDTVAPQLLDAVLRCNGVAVRLTEVEAYGGMQDPGSHAARGPTARNSVMFGPAGHLYVYLIYGMHCCANIVVGPEDEASAVLVRAGEVVEGLDLARERRPAIRDSDLARGPACLCKALGIDRSHDGVRLVDAKPTLGQRSRSVGNSVRQLEEGKQGAVAMLQRIDDAQAVSGAHCSLDGACGNVVELQLAAKPVQQFCTGPRVGLRQAPDWPWRFWLPDEASVSVYRPAAQKRTR